MSLKDLSMKKAVILLSGGIPLRQTVNRPVFAGQGEEIFYTNTVEES
jgi:hypothetical protein